MHEPRVHIWDMAHNPRPSSLGALAESGQDSNLFNWLRDLDSREPSLSPARSWLNYPYFMFARHPRLQPKDGANVETGRRSFEKTLSDQESRMAKHEHGANILQGLTPEQQQQLSALVVDCLAEFEEHGERAKHGKNLTRLTKEAASRQRGLDKKVSQVRTALEQLYLYAQKLDPWLGTAHAGFAQNGLTALKELSHYQSAEEWEKDRQNHGRIAQIPSPNDPTTSAMVQLYWFFRHECRFSANESEIRVALIREACFGRWKKPIRIVPFHKSARSGCKSIPDPESRGAGAVAQAVRRFRAKT